MPALDALRAFEAAARHLSFSRAAVEISVTQAAVSHRVRELELRLDKRLFHRLTRRVALTDDGARLALAVRRGLDHIAEGLAALDPVATGAGALRLSVLPSFAQRWLVPRLPRLRARHPELELKLIADGELADLHTGGADLAIRFGRGQYPGLRAEFLMADAVMPVCSPDFMRRIAQPDRLEAVLNHPLLHDSDCPRHVSGECWPSWLASAGRPDLPCPVGASFSCATLTLDAAAAGLGIALGRRSLLEADLTSGRLVPAWLHAAPTAFSYWLVGLPERLARPDAALLRAWLLDEIRFTSARGAQ